MVPVKFPGRHCYVHYVISMLLIAGISGSIGCVYEKEDILYPPPACDTAGVNYSEEIVQILSTNCYSCHNAANSAVSGAGILLDEYHEVKHHVDDGDISGVINHRPGFPQMPKNAAKLSDCDIAKIDAWIKAGAPEN